MPVLPPGLEVYKSTPWFDAQTTPTGLLRSHRLKAGSWGRIVVERGVVVYTIESDPQVAFALNEALPGIVEPECPHRVQARGEARFRVEFLR